MPDVVRCSSCRKETYAGQTHCPHCRLTLVPLAPERPVEAEASSVQPSIQHDQFVSDLRSGVLSLRYNSERLNSESFYHVWPSLYAQQLAVKFFLFPLATVGAIVGLFWADNLAKGGIVSGPAVFVVG